MKKWVLITVLALLLTGMVSVGRAQSEEGVSAGEGEYAAASQDGEEVYYPLFCCAWENEEGLMVTEQCEKHALLWEATLSMLETGEADMALYSYYEWQAEIISLYNIWGDMVNEAIKPKIEVSKSLCIQMMEMQLDAMQSSYQAHESDIDPQEIYYQAELWMRDHAAWLCRMIGTLDMVP